MSQRLAGEKVFRGIQIARRSRLGAGVLTELIIIDGGRNRCVQCIPLFVNRKRRTARKQTN
jgi:hypothetical protein